MDSLRRTKVINAKLKKSRNDPENIVSRWSMGLKNFAQTLPKNKLHLLYSLPKVYKNKLQKPNKIN